MNTIIEDPNNLNKLYNNWAGRNVVFDRVTNSYQQFNNGNAFTGAVMVSLDGQGTVGWDSVITGPQDTNLTVQNLTFTNETGTNSWIVNGNTNYLNVTSLTGQIAYISDLGFTNGTGINGNIINLNVSGNMTGINSNITNLNVSGNMTGNTASFVNNISALYIQGSNTYPIHTYTSSVAISGYSQPLILFSGTTSTQSITLPQANLTPGLEIKIINRSTQSLQITNRVVDYMNGTGAIGLSMSPFTSQAFVSDSSNSWWTI